jgi:hypothetical protein
MCTVLIPLIRTLPDGPGGTFARASPAGSIPSRENRLQENYDSERARESSNATADVHAEK